MGGLSSALTEALCMTRRLPAAEAAPRLAAFLPRIDRGEPPMLFTLSTVSDRSDGKIAHLDGLNLARAWCWQSLAPHLSGEALDNTGAAAQRHLDAALPFLASDYAGEL